MPVVIRNILSKSEIDDIRRAFESEGIDINSTTGDKVTTHTSNLFSIDGKISRHTRERIRKHMPIHKTLPISIINGDVKPHIDKPADGTKNHKETTLLYLEGDGKLCVEGKEIDITPGTLVKFNAKERHWTEGCSKKKLLIGPLSEDGIRVGFAAQRSIQNTTHQNGGVKSRKSRDSCSTHKKLCKYNRKTRKTRRQKRHNYKKNIKY